MKMFGRTALLALTAVSASSVVPTDDAPATDIPMAELGEMSPTIAMPPVQDLLDTDIKADPMAPLPEELVEEEEEALPDNLSDLVAHFWGDEPRDRQMECLAGAVYFETRGESLDGQLAVAQVVANRAESSRFPDSYCGVVFQRKQFSFVRGGQLPAIKRGSRAWHRAVAIARIVDGGHLDSKVSDALFFHATHVNPRWRLTRVGSVGNHIFYR
ncbi:cell wall hydrolase [Sphingomicrobium flavum]|uniref:cell wall hydrolase n=1 Tax=Sphingomicrobium flavum TaxID=1229164 RepID=UPI0021AE285F|nr:cell wall hydrolase [Sphingomicrobium flavum]